MVKTLESACLRYSDRRTGKISQSIERSEEIPVGVNGSFGNRRRERYFATVIITWLWVSVKVTGTFG